MKERSASCSTTHAGESSRRAPTWACGPTIIPTCCASSIGTLNVIGPLAGGCKWPKGVQRAAILSGRLAGGSSARYVSCHGPGAIVGPEAGSLHQPLRALSRTGESARVVGGNNSEATRLPGLCFRIVGQVGLLLGKGRAKAWCLLATVSQLAFRQCFGI